MKCSSRRNCDRGRHRVGATRARLNEVQFLKELRPWDSSLDCPRFFGSLNEVQFLKELRLGPGARARYRHLASMKCSSRKNCDASQATFLVSASSFNEVQFPKELRLVSTPRQQRDGTASMKCSSRRNCDPERRRRRKCRDASMKCSSRRNCNTEATHAISPTTSMPQ